jgi:tetratricopeptide (TPR) repeat protein
MKKTTFVALLLLSLQGFAGDLMSSTQAIESEWASIYYKLPKNQQAVAYGALLNKAKQLAGQFPNKAEPLFWQAVILATNAEHQDGFSALQSINQSKELLLEAIGMDPKTANGSAYVTLATLYYMVPQWPIAFGDNEKAEQMFQEALKINPNGIDANYFYGDYLLANNKSQEAQQYFEKALLAPSRKEQQFADNKLKDEVKLALANTKSRKINAVKPAFLSLFNSANLK